MNYCPRCGAKLGSKMDGGRVRPACLAEGCGFIFFGEHSIGCGGVVIRDNKALLIQRGINPNRGAWQIPGGYVEADEQIVHAVEREVLEEAGLVAKVIDVVGIRHATTEPNSNIYVVFRLDAPTGEPSYDGGRDHRRGLLQHGRNQQDGRSPRVLSLVNPTRPCHTGGIGSPA